MSDISLNVYPLPKHVSLAGGRIKINKINLLFETEDTILIRLVDFSAFLSNDSDTYCSVTFESLKAFNCDDCNFPEYIESNEVYAINVEAQKITIYSNNSRSRYYGLLMLKQLILADNLYQSMSLLDYPHMKTRGIIEGFYGKPWSASDRFEAISTISNHKMNTYVYAPKDDAYHREKWRELYPQDVLNNIKRLYNHCQDKFVDFYYTLGPGLSMKYSDDGNFDMLLKKYIQLYEIGIKHFGILFDDIPSRLMHEEDKSKFEELACAHAFIINKLYKELKSLNSEIQLLVCGTVYYGRGNEAYNVKLGSLIPSDIKMFWTGRSICSQELDSRDARFFYKNTVHKPLYWDNYPVNDTNMQYELHLGPITGRDFDLYMYTEGIVSNVMEYKEASMIPVITICHYLWNCEKYDRERSLNSAVLEVVGDEDFEDFMRFNRYCLKSCLSPIGSDEFIEKVIDFKCAANKNSVEFIRTIKDLQYYFSSNIQSSKTLKKNMKNRKLLKEISPWLTKFQNFNRFCVLMLGYMIALQEKRKISGVLLGVKAFMLGKKLLRNPIQMMNVETQVFLESGG